ncbi:hypothetical protein [Salinisphaera sp. LB1]|uniref:hypothetical protein n=1 Tax=Salinisphaera sp. LB1 TaxID=2183911 RepID=UPI000D7DA872|nr:hypothetical protein [Salinisphaera sp. LB1]AWN15961.1 hypothetical protein SALB1_1763 [Salinisphaera sp. LB1]
MEFDLMALSRVVIRTRVGCGALGRARCRLDSPGYSGAQDRIGLPVSPWLRPTVGT